MPPRGNDVEVEETDAIDARSRGRGPCAARSPGAGRREPGHRSGLVQRSGRLVLVHADQLDGSSSQSWVLTNGLQQLPVRAPADLWVDPGTRVRLEGTLVDGALVLADSVTAVEQLAPAPSALAADPLAAAPSMHSTAIMLFGFSGGPSDAELPPAASSAASAGAVAFGPDPGSLNSYYLEQTYGQLGFTGQVFGPLNVVDSGEVVLGRRPVALGRGGRSGVRGQRRRLPARGLRLPLAADVPICGNRGDRRQARLD